MIATRTIKEELMPTAKGSFQVLSGDEDTYEERDGGGRLAHASGEQAFSGDITGDGSVHWLSLYREDKSARLIGLQRINGTVDGRTGTFVIEATSDHTGQSSSGSWAIVEGSGTGELEGIRGHGSFEAPGGPNASYELEYEIG
jgi:hypothetical protein